MFRADSHAQKANFSLLEHLNLDLELDEFPVAVPALNGGKKRESASFKHAHDSAMPVKIQSIQRVSQTARLDFDPKQPLFFPPLSASGDWRNPGIAFWRTETEEDIRKRWSKEKVELTREWKRRWRESGKRVARNSR
jgi:hypothetical protein